MAKDWIKGAVNPSHKGFCTPESKKTCTPRRKAFAETMKKHHGFHQDGGPAYNKEQFSKDLNENRKRTGNY